MTIDKSKKTTALICLIKQQKWEQVLVFSRTKHGANRIAEKLTRSKIPSAAIHGNKSQGARTKALADFKNGAIKVLVATDIAARGIDISELPIVVNLDLPNTAADYVHRIGRTGRAGASGQAWSFVCAEESTVFGNYEFSDGHRRNLCPRSHLRNSRYNRGRPELGRTCLRSSVRLNRRYKLLALYNPLCKGSSLFARPRHSDF